MSKAIPVTIFLYTIYLIFYLQEMKDGAKLPFFREITQKWWKVVAFVMEVYLWVFPLLLVLK